MGMTDPIADMLTRIRNASRARHQKVAVPWSRVKENIVKVLIEEGYLKEAKKAKAPQGGGDELLIQLRFDRENRPIIAGMKRVSSPGRRVYVGAREVHGNAGRRPVGAARAVRENVSGGIHVPHPLDRQSRINR